MHSLPNNISASIVFLRASEWSERSVHTVVLSLTFLLASERSERDTLRSVQLRIADYIIIMYMQNFVLITRKEGGA